MLIRRSVVLLFLFTCLPLFAQDPNRKTGFTFFFGSPDNGVSVRRRVTPAWTVLGTLAYSRNGQDFGSAILLPDQTFWSLGAGIRRTFRSEELRPFIEVDGTLRRTEISSCNRISYPSVSAAGGVEYFVAKRVSIDGLAGLTHSTFTERCTQNRFDSHGVGTFRSALSLTFWF